MSLPVREARGAGEYAVVLTLKLEGESILSRLWSMAECELTNTCVPFYERMAKMPSTARLMKGVYCKGKYLECARYMVYKAHGREDIPEDLSPSDFESIRSIIKPSLSY
jgi:hypothetical protein